VLDEVKGKEGHRMFGWFCSALEDAGEG
jgi:hypothetical protein